MSQSIDKLAMTAKIKEQILDILNDDDTAVDIQEVIWEELFPLQLSNDDEIQMNTLFESCLEEVRQQIRTTLAGFSDYLELEKG